MQFETKYEHTKMKGFNKKSAVSTKIYEERD